MPQTLSAAPSNAPAQPIAGISIAPGASAPSAEKSFGDRVLSSSWLPVKLLAIIGLSIPAIYAIWFAATQESFGILIAVIPDMVAAVIFAGFILVATFFYDEH